MDDEPHPMGNTNSDVVMTGARPGTEVNAAVTDTDTDEDDIVHQEIKTAAVIEDDRGTQNVIVAVSDFARHNFKNHFRNMNQYDH